MQFSPANFTHTRRLARFNARLYVAAIIGVTIGTGIAAWPAAPSIVRVAALIGAVVALWYSFASLFAFHCMFDRPEFLAGRWLSNEVTEPPVRWVQISAGLDETTLPVETVFPASEGVNLDIYDPRLMTEPAITKARERARSSSRSSSVSELPVEDGWAGLVVITLAAHEVRDPAARERLFAEIVRVAAPGGVVLLIEHLRNLPAVLAFGPGALHFLPRSEWLRLIALSGMRLVGERGITPFIRVFHCRRASAP